MSFPARSSRRGILSPVVPTVLLVLLAVPGLAWAQSLAELAKQEEARRQAVKGEAKVYTNKDLARAGGTTPVSTITLPPTSARVGGGTQSAADQPSPGTGAAPAAEAAQPAAGQTPEKPESGEKNDEESWRKRMTDLQDRLSRAQVLADALQSRINALTTDFVNRDDPAQRAQISTDRQRALGELDRMNKDIERLKKDIADLQEEARKAGVPPGWLR